MIQLYEIYASIQGESTYAGLPCVFIRTAGCNLRCRYCDTDYAFEPKFGMEIEEIVGRIEQYAPIRLVEITGGEPLCQEETIALMKRFIDEGYRVLLETNGSVLLKDVPDDVHIIMDVKCPGSWEQDSLLEDNLLWLKPDRDEIKYVLTDRFDYEYAIEFIRRYNLMNYTNLLSPVLGELDPEELAGWIMDDKPPVRLQLQLHRIIWDPDRQGV